MFLIWPAVSSGKRRQNSMALRASWRPGNRKLRLGGCKAPVREKLSPTLALATFMHSTRTPFVCQKLPENREKKRRTTEQPAYAEA